MEDRRKMRIVPAWLVADHVALRTPEGKRAARAIDRAREIGKAGGAPIFWYSETHGFSARDRLDPRQAVPED